MEGFEVTAAPLMNPEREARRAGIDQADRQVAAQRLRARGFSYRRIAETLGIGYGTVSAWLYGGSQPAARKERIEPLAAPAPKQAAAAQGTAMLELRVAMLEAGLARVQRDAAQREAELLAELDSLRGALAVASGAGGSLTRLLRWSRGRQAA